MKYKRITTLCLAVCNIAFVLWGTYVLALSVHLSQLIPPNWRTQFPNSIPVLYAMFGANALILLLLAWGSGRLPRSRRWGITICITAYCLELLTWFIEIPIRHLSVQMDKYLRSDGLIIFAKSFSATSWNSRNIRSDEVFLSGIRCRHPFAY